jgi:hypothetical protein
MGNAGDRAVIDAGRPFSTESDSDPSPTAQLTMTRSV